MKRILKTFLEAAVESIIPIAAGVALISLIVHLNKKHTEKLKAGGPPYHLEIEIPTNATAGAGGYTNIPTSWRLDTSVTATTSVLVWSTNLNEWVEMQDTPSGLVAYPKPWVTNVSPVHVGNIERDTNGGYYFVSRETMMFYMRIGWLHGRIGGDEEEFKELADLIASGDTNKFAEFEVRYRVKHGSPNK